MMFLLLAILSSALISVFMRASTSKVQNNFGMLTVNYIICLCTAAVYTNYNFLPRNTDLLPTLIMGTVNGFLYLLSFVVFQANVKRNGVVLSSIFMRLGLLVPIVVSVAFFGEVPTPLQAIGFLVAVAAIILINLGAGKEKNVAASGLIILLLSAGGGDAMSKVFEQKGTPSLSEQFLLYTFFTALILCTILMLIKKQGIGKNELIFGTLVGIPNFFSAKFLLKALTSVPAVIVYPTFSVATIMIVALSGILLFKERLNKRQWIAIGAILAALALLNI